MELNRKNKLRFVILFMFSSIIIVNLSAFTPDDNTDIEINGLGNPPYPRSINQLNCYYQNGYVYRVVTLLPLVEP